MKTPRNWTMPVMGLGLALGFATLALAQVAAPPAALPTAKRVQVTGEVIETWCSVSAIMYAYGTAHHQCAAWCTAGGIPVGLKDKDGTYYMILKIEDDDSNVANPRLAHFLTHDVTVDGDLIERDGVKYLIVTKVTDDKGVVNQTHEANGIVPFGN
jgi:hypothetical protein